jgi:hypothetical protein
LWVAENIDNLGKSKEAITLKRGLYTDIPHSEARDFYPLLGEVGKDIIKGEIGGKSITDMACNGADF